MIANLLKYVPLAKLLSAALSALTGYRPTWIERGLENLPQLVASLETKPMSREEKFMTVFTEFQGLVKALGGRIDLSEEARDKVELVVRVVLTIVRWRSETK